MSEINFEDAIDVVLKYHHEQAEVIFTSDVDDERKTAFIRTETLREVTKRLVRDVLPQDEKNQYIRKMKSIYTALYSTIFFKKSIMEENPNG